LLSLVRAPRSMTARLTNFLYSELVTLFIMNYDERLGSVEKCICDLAFMACWCGLINIHGRFESFVAISRPDSTFLKQMHDSAVNMLYFILSYPHL
jgi:hypothetical protein